MNNTSSVLVNVTFLYKHFCGRRSTLNSQLVSYGSSELINVIQVHLSPSAAHFDNFLSLSHIDDKFKDHEQVRLLYLISACTAEKDWIQGVFSGSLECPNIFSNFSRVEGRTLDCIVHVVTFQGIIDPDSDGSLYYVRSIELVSCW